MNLTAIASRVAAGETVTFVARGHSMDPIVRDKDKVTVAPLVPPVRKGEVVLAKVRGRWYLHKVMRVASGQALIGNNLGHQNGWTAFSNIVGKLVKDGETKPTRKQRIAQAKSDARRKKLRIDKEGVRDKLPFNEECYDAAEHDGLLALVLAVQNFDKDWLTDACRPDL